MSQGRAREFLHRYRPSWWISLALAALGTTSLLWALVMLHTGSGDRVRQALSAGQRVHVELSTGKTEGAMRHLGKAAPTPARPVEPAPTATVSAKPASSPASKKSAAAGENPLPPPEEIPKGDTALPDPNSDILLETATGKLPMISSTGLKPSEYYAKPYTRLGKAPIIGFLVVGVGQQRDHSATALALPDGVSLALSPYADHAEIWAKNARHLGHEVFLELPLQSARYPATDSGPWALLSDASEKENIANLLRVMERASGYAGVVAGLDENFTFGMTALSPVLDEINRRGLMMLCGDKTSGMGQVLGHKDSIRGGCADVILDAEMTPEAIYAALSRLEERARASGQAFGILRARPLSLSIVSGWIGGMKSRHLRLAPVSAIIPQPPALAPEGDAAGKKPAGEKKPEKKEEKKKEPAKEQGEQPAKGGHE